MNIHFAPLQGYTEDCYRRLHHALCEGVDVYYTPFMRLEHGEVRSKDLRDVQPERNQGIPLVPQVIVRDADELQRLIDVLRPMDYQRVDINMGCPFPLQTRHGRGAGLLPHPDQVERICSLIRQSADIQFSIKMRLGLTSPDEWQTLMPILADTPLTHITLHPRTGAQGYKGEVLMEAFEAFAHACPHPLVYNGDLTTLADIRRIEQRFPTLSGIMLGRGLLARPTLAEEYKRGEAMTDTDVIQRIKALHDGLLADYRRIIPSEAQQWQKVRTFWDHMEPTLGRKAWKKIHKAGSMRNYLLAIQELG